ncbi:MAG: hypothetical protein A3G87_00030 [Omnitrophica bacterium RIFCSPLOWO2_12_FULL_50_11]|nr:MAG: hypothetical protein A3G87_00030 [Omnitrophica bacterium RIFCSPLOWO2_12_FULL_50_11]
MDRMGKYIYGIIEERKQKRFDIPGISGGEARPYTIPQGEFSAVVSDGPLEIYENTQENLLAHNRVLETVMKDYDVFPLRFGTVAKTEEEVRELLKMTSDQLSEAIRAVRGKVEYDVEIDVDEKKLLQEVQANSPVIQQIKSLSQGRTVTLDEQIKVGKVVAQELVKEKLALAAFVKNSLSFGIEKITSLRLPRPETLLNLAFLLKKENTPAFENLIQELDQKLEDKLRFKVTGPLPPYHFSELKLLVVDFDRVNEARKDLGLPGETTESEIKKAYRNLAKKFHPDQARGEDQEAEATFRRIDASYKLLSKYCERNPRDRYHFRPEEFGERIILLDRDDPEVVG